MNDKLSTIQRIFRDVLDEPDLDVDESFSMQDHEDWDSVATVQIVLAIEESFGKRLSTDEVAEISSVADILRLF